MANIFIAWELGSGLGHLSYLVPITNALAEKGHTVTLVINDPSNIERFSFPDSVKIIAAPSHRTFPRKPPQTVSLSCILIDRGFQNPTILKGILRCWHGLFDLTKPDLFIFDYAPTAMLAARDTHCPKVIIGSGFSEPDPGQPGLVMLPGYKGAETTAIRHEAHIVKCVNQICNDLSLPPIKYLSDLYLHDLALISTLPPLDIHNRSTKTSLYFQLNATQENSHKIEWPANGKKCVFAYLKAGNASFLPSIEALAKSDTNVICYCNHVTPELATKYGNKNIQFSTAPLDIHSLLQKADAVVCHAGKGTISAALKEAVPLLLLPTHMEQNMNAIRVQSMQLGLRGQVEHGAKGVLQSLNKLINNDDFSTNATRFSHDVMNSKGLSSEQEVVSSICELLN